MNTTAASLMGCLIVFCAMQTAFVYAEADIFVYPAKGQTDKQLTNDRYACHVWAVQQTGFDPTKFAAPIAPQVVRVPLPANEARGATGAGAVIGAIAGAVIGEATGHHSGGSAAIGGVLGGITGSSVERQGELDARARAEQQAASMDQQSRARAERDLQRSDYRRAISACLEARGYTVR